MNLRHLRSLAGRYAFAVVAMGVSVWLRHLLVPLLGNETIYLTLYPTLIAISYFFGIGPGILAFAVGIPASFTMVAGAGMSWVFSPARLIEASCVAATSFGFVGFALHLQTRRKAAEDSIGRLIDDLPFPAIIHSEDGRVVSVNRAWTEISGYTHEDIPTIALWTEKAYGKARESARGKIREIYDIKSRVDVGEMEITTSKGEKRYWQFSSAPLTRDSKGNRRVISTAADVTHRKQDERKLAESEVRLRSVIDHLDEGVVMSDLSGNVFHWNPVAYAIHESMTREQGETHFTEHERLFELRTADGQVIAVDDWPLARILRGEILREWEIHVHRRHDEWHRVFSYGGTLIRDTSGEPMLAIVTIRDITERKRTEDALRDSEKRFRLMGETIPYGVWQTDAHGNAKYVSQSFLSLLGMTLEETRNFGWTSRLASSDLVPLKEKWRHCMATGEMWDCELRLLDNDGSSHTVLSRALPLRNESGRIDSWVGINLDIDLRKKMEEELKASKESAEKANQAKSEFLATMSHEIRTPLNAIIGFSELLTLGTGSEGERKEFAHRIRQNGQLLVRLIDDILDLSKIEAGRLQVERVETNFQEMLSDVAAVMKRLTDEKGLVFSLEVEDSLPEIILSDPTRLKQILINVIGNSIKFTSKGSIQVQARAESAKGFLAVVVRDTGVGIAKESAEKLFEPFVQADASTTRQFGGTGLGLALSRRLAQALGGNVRLVESRPGVGSVFEITLPTRGARHRARALPLAQPKADARARIDGVRILLAEDMADNQLLMTKMLTLSGARVEVATNGEEAVEKALSGDFDIVLMDIRMPRLDGRQATERLRAQGYVVPIVALTAHALREEVERCRQAGCDDHLAKPVRKEELIRVIRKFVSRLRESERSD